MSQSQCQTITAHVDTIVSWCQQLPWRGVAWSGALIGASSGVTSSVATALVVARNSAQRWRHAPVVCRCVLTAWLSADSRLHWTVRRNYRWMRHCFIWLISLLYCANNIANYMLLGAAEIEWRLHTKLLRRPCTENVLSSAVGLSTTVVLFVEASDRSWTMLSKRDIVATSRFPLRSV